MELKFRKFTDMTDDEVRRIVGDIFNPNKITCIRRYKKDDSIVCKVYMTWVYNDDDGKEVSYVSGQELTLRNPFIYGLHSAIEIDCSVDGTDFDRLAKFCFVKGMVPWLEDNPYLEELKENAKKGKEV